MEFQITNNGRVIRKGRNAWPIDRLHENQQNGMVCLDGTWVKLADIHEAQQQLNIIANQQSTLTVTNADPRFAREYEEAIEDHEGQMEHRIPSTSLDVERMLNALNGSNGVRHQEHLELPSTAPKSQLRKSGVVFNTLPCECEHLPLPSTFVPNQQTKPVNRLAGIGEHLELPSTYRKVS